MALSPIRVDEILVMRREPSAGAGFGRRRRNPSVRGRQHVQVTEPFILNSSVIDADEIYLECRLKDTVCEYAITWKSDNLSDSEAVAKDTYKYAEEVFNMLKRHGEYLAFQPLMLMCETVPNSSGATEHLKRFKVA